MISIIIPTYNMPNTKFYLRRCLDSIDEQTYTDFEVVMPDNSHHFTRAKIQKMIEDYDFPITYFVSDEEGSAANTNAGIRKAKGDLIKILHMDDYFAHEDALQEIADNFKGEWLVTACTHSRDDGLFHNNHTASWNDDMLKGNNTIGSPSVLTFKRGIGAWFDEDAHWIFDCIMYDWLYKKYGEPTILDDINVVIGIHEGQATNQISDEDKLGEISRYV